MEVEDDAGATAEVEASIVNLTLTPTPTLTLTLSLSLTLTPTPTLTLTLQGAVQMEAVKRSSRLTRVPQAKRAKLAAATTRAPLPDPALDPPRRCVP